MTPPISVDPDRLGELCRKWQVAELSLFGSVLRDDFGPESDIDVLVAFESGARVGFIGLGQFADELSQMFGRKVDLVPRAGLKPLIKDSVLSSAHTLYAA